MRASTLTASGALPRTTTSSIQPRATLKDLVLERRGQSECQRVARLARGILGACRATAQDGQQQQGQRSDHLRISFAAASGDAQVVFRITSFMMMKAPRPCSSSVLRARLR